MLNRFCKFSKVLKSTLLERGFFLSLWEFKFPVSPDLVYLFTNFHLCLCSTWSTTIDVPENIQGISNTDIEQV